MFTEASRSKPGLRWQRINHIDDAALLTFAGIVRFLKQLYLLAYGFIEGTMAVLWAACPCLHSTAPVLVGREDYPCVNVCMYRLI